MVMACGRVEKLKLPVLILRREGPGSARLMLLQSFWHTAAGSAVLRPIKTEDSGMSSLGLKLAVLLGQKAGAGHGIWQQWRLLLKAPLKQMTIQNAAQSRIHT